LSEWEEQALNRQGRKEEDAKIAEESLRSLRALFATLAVNLPYSPKQSALIRQPQPVRYEKRGFHHVTT
jgi:hypothetical protein